MSAPTAGFGRFDAAARSACLVIAFVALASALTGTATGHRPTVLIAGSICILACLAGLFGRPGTGGRQSPRPRPGPPEDG
jgi:hypothetical protein